ncbi:glutathione S-transferase family protein [Azospirillum halopraeferens]|uniref:glutathione S-transferase family protein n=1 Tax=Azospirillum halopraeferens TaxID=34010 RepID=UPI000422A547|nr:glutathione S-transferase C-terminal domain-containing protein [Azospirillum halopraeferens]
MITLYTFPTPNGHKASILLEELGLKYRVHRLDLMAGENRSAAYLAISPAGKLPAVAEEMPGGVTRRLFGSGAILLHYAECAGRLLPTGAARDETLCWFQFGISDLGPIAVDLFRFAVRAPEKIPYAIDLYRTELQRYYDALDRRLGEATYLGGDEYSIADIACYPFVAVAAEGGRLNDQANLQRWRALIAERPAVQRGMAVPT